MSSSGSVYVMFWWFLDCFAKIFFFDFWNFSKSFLAIFPPCFQNFRSPKVPTLTKISQKSPTKAGTFGDFWGVGPPPKWNLTQSNDANHSLNANNVPVSQLNKIYFNRGNYVLCIKQICLKTTKLYTKLLSY